MRRKYPPQSQLYPQSLQEDQVAPVEPDVTANDNTNVNANANDNTNEIETNADNGTSTSVGTAATTTGSRSRPKKVGGVFLGCCCDYRRALIILSFIGMILCMFYVILLLLVEATVQTYFDGEELQSGFNSETVDIYRTSLKWIAILTGIGMFFSILGIIGGCFFHRGLVNCFIIYTIIGNLICIALELQSSVRIIRRFNDRDDVDDDFFRQCNEDEADDIFCVGSTDERGLFNFSSYGARILLILIFTFPALKFNQEVRKGILCQDTYVEQEEYSCCCLPPYHEYEDDNDDDDNADDERNHDNEFDDEQKQQSQNGIDDYDNGIDTTETVPK